MAMLDDVCHEETHLQLCPGFRAWIAEIVDPVGISKIGCQIPWPASGGPLSFESIVNSSWKRELVWRRFSVEVFGMFGNDDE
jgi:predicted anti-sigma-YlaC factor YlaD